LAADAGAEVIVVLGGSTRPQTSPRPMHEINEAGDRLLYAADLYRRKVAPQLLVSGGIAPAMTAGNTAAMWTVNRCGSDCAQVIGENAVTWDVHLADGRWTGSVKRPDAVDCKNGTAAPGTSVLSLDAQTLRGTVISTSEGPACGSPAPITAGAVYIDMDQA
jgi:hypothetical protein